MARILVNGFKAKGGGGASILRNYLCARQLLRSDHFYLVLVPNDRDFSSVGGNGVQIVSLSPIWDSNVLAPILYLFVFPRLLRRHSVDALLNFGDIPIRARVPQAYLFDWAYAAYPKSEVWARLSWNGRVMRRLKARVIARLIGHADVVIAQTKSIGKRLQDEYQLRNVRVVPNAVSVDRETERGEWSCHLPAKRIRLLCLAQYYEHKNLEVLLPLARQIRDAGLDYVVVITIDKGQHRRASRLLSAIAKAGLGDYLINVGPVPLESVPSLYRQCDALLLPTLLESFSGTYVEAMYFRRPILTSDFSFARDICGEAAAFFDPDSPDDILRTIRHVFESEGEVSRLTTAGEQRLKAMWTWAEVVKALDDVVDQELVPRIGDRHSTSRS